MAYKDNFKVIGVRSQIGVNNIHLGQGFKEGIAFLQTTDATTTTILTIPIPTSPKSIVRIGVGITAIQSDGLKSARSGTILQSIAFYNGTTTSTVVSQNPITMSSSTGLTVSASYVLSGDNMLVRVTGAAATTINWGCDYDIVQCAAST